ncbi:MAG TPA: hypothetical protein VFQ85_17280 [Mycobacteriales bacterium]|jgi:hypothetical protein|nr:hypothetical protein [Mycobacteriales bacterium]
MTTRRVRRSVRRSGNGLNLAVDVDAAVAVNTGSGRVSAVSVTGTTTADQHSARTRRTGAGETTRGDT